MMQTNKLYPVLSTQNIHPRDEFISFEEEGHKYTITSDPNTTYTSVTTWNHTHFPKFDADAIIKKMMKGKNWEPGNKYWGMSAEQIKKQWLDNGAEVSGAGTDMHFQIECFMNNPNMAPGYTHKELYDNWMKEIKDQETSSVEWNYFIKFVQENLDLKPYRTEWLIYHEELKLSGSIDMVYEKPDGSLVIYDWKRSKEIKRVNNYNKFASTFVISHLPDTNYWHYSLQLNTYKAILEAKYGKKVTELYLVRLHPDCEDNTYDLIPVLDLSKDIGILFDLRREIMKLELQEQKKSPREKEKQD